MPFNAQQLQEHVFPYAGDDPETDIMLFFTDNKNEPRSINVRRCIETDEEFTGNAFGYEGQDLEDFITACPRVPNLPITFSYDTVADNNNVIEKSHFKDTDGLIFAYQNVYKNRYISSLSTYSHVAYPSALQYLGSRGKQEVVFENVLNLNIPRQGSEVFAIRILFKEGDGGVWKLIDEVPAEIGQLENFSYTPENEDFLGTYSFKNNQVYPVIPLEQGSKTFDKLPAKAQTQCFSGGRLMYGNYEEGFDGVNAFAVSQVVYKDRLQDFVSFDLDVEPCFIEGGHSFTDSTFNPLSSGFTINTAGLPDVIPPSIYEVNIKVRPNRNVHVYAKSYNESKLESSSKGLDGLGFTNSIPTPNSLYPNSGLGLQTVFGESTQSLKQQGQAPGGVATFRWKNSDVGDIWGSVGTSPANPLILDVNLIEVKLIFQTLQELTNQDLASALKIMLSGEGSSNIETVLFNGYNIEKIFIQGDDVNNTLSRNGAIYQANRNLGLKNQDTFKQNSRLAELVSFVHGDFFGQQYGEGNQQFNTDTLQRPEGFFILNKFNALFGFESFNTFDTETIKGFRLKVCDVIPDDSEGDGILTCFPFPALGQGTPGYYAPNYIQSQLGETFGEAYTIANHSPNPWKIEGPQGSEQFDLGTTQHIRWPRVTYQFEESLSLEDREIFYRIGSWAVLDREGVINEEWQDLYKITITGCEGTHLAVKGNEGSSSIVNDWLGDEFTFGLSGGFINIPGDPSFGMMESLGANSKYWASYIEKLNFGSIEGWADAQINQTDQYGNIISEDLLDLNLTPPPNTLNPNLPTYDATSFSRFSVIDGDGGPGGKMTIERPFSDSSISPDGETENVTIPSYSPGDYADTYIINEYVQDQIDEGNLPEGTIVGPTSTVPTGNRFGSVWSTTFSALCENLPYINIKGIYTDVTNQENIISTDPKKKLAFNSSVMELVSSQTNLGTLGDTTLSFKTRATHDFGIAYYDKRGRISKVNKLTSVYVPGYSITERSGNPKGPVSINIDIKHTAPSWAERYKIYYSNRNESSKFIQYSSGGAFVEKGGSLIKDKLYVSLNYLQSSKISYAKGYGARDADTDEPTLYRYSKGDVLRVLSYYNGDGDRVWAGEDDSFEVLGVETLVSNLEDHPLYSEGDFTEDADLRKLQRNGQFLVLKDNPNSLGFSAEDVSSLNDSWSKRCVFEIVSPRKESDEELQPYFETNYGGRILEDPDGNLDDNGNIILIHEQPEGGHIIEEGDVFFRQVAVNFREFSTTSGTTVTAFPDLFIVDEEGNDASQSNFLPYYLESNTATDLHRSVAKGYGKPNFIDRDEFRKKMQSSVIFSDKTTSDQFVVKHTSFPNDKQQSFDLPEKHGDLNYLAGEDEYITTLQENKSAVIPVDRSITSTAAGTESLNISDKVLNSAKFYFGEGGPAGNPESVVEIDGYIYYADKHNKRISRLSPGGQTVENISDFGMEEYFRRQFDRLLNSSTHLNASDIRIPSGFDPMENEFIVSFLRPSDINSTVQEGQFTTTPLSSSLAELELNGDEPFVNTISFDHSGGKAWKTRYSFNSTNYSDVNNNFISFKKSGTHFVWDHGKNESRNKFHGAKYMSMIKPVSVAQRSMGASATKLYNALSLEGRYDWPAVIKTHTETATIPTFTNYEGTKYSAIPKSKNSSSTSNVKSIGIIESAAIVGYVEGGDATELFDELDITFTSPVSTSLLLGEGVSVTRIFGSGMLEGQINSDIPLTPAEKINDYTIRYSTGGIPGVATVFQPGDTILHVGNSSVHGDNLRDKYATVMLLNNSEEEAELYSVNLEVSGSKLDPS
tara:strand:+ start:1489 stop:6912 length:5424 start_codon:yes stop_codon:yes gene_type:complete